MKTKIFFLSVLLSFKSLNAQNENLPSIAVANPNVNALSIKPESGSKMMRLELIKMNKYKVYDEFDMADVLKAKEVYRTQCYGQNCLVGLGKELNVDYVMCGSLDGLGNKIVVTIKIVDVKNQTIFKSAVREFDNQEIEMQRMIEIILKEMHGLQSDRSFKIDLLLKMNSLPPIMLAK